MEILLNLFKFWPQLVLFACLWVGLVVLATKWRWLKAELATIKDLTGILAILLGGAWVYQIFIYEEWVKPAMQAPHVTITSAAEQVGMKDRLHAIQIRSTLKNESKVKVFVLAYWLDVYGYSVKPKDEQGQQQFATAEIHSLNTDAAAHRKTHAREYAAAEPKILQIEPLLRSDWWLESGEEVSITRTIFVSDQYDVAQISFHAKTARDKQHICLHWATSDIPGERSGEITPLTYIRNDAATDCKNLGKLERFDRTKQAHQTLRQRTGLSTTDSIIELPLLQMQPKKAASK